MTASTALGLFALASAVASGAGYYLLARAFGLWPFTLPSEPECEGCRARDEWPEDPAARADAWSGVDPRHGDDGNSGHG